MALPTTGPISLGKIQTEFGGSNPASLSEYYYNGTHVKTTNNGKIPSSGINKFSNYYGAIKLSTVPLIAQPRIHSMGVGSCQAMCWYQGTNGNNTWIQMNVVRPNLWNEIFGGTPNTVTLFGTGREVTLKVKTSASGAETIIHDAGNNSGPYMSADDKTDDKSLYNPAKYKTVTLNANGDIWVYARYNEYDGGDCEGGYIHAVACT